MPAGIIAGMATALWEQRLAPAMRRRGRWVEVHRTETAAQARKAVQNLRGGILAVPGSPRRWEFEADAVPPKVGRPPNLRGIVLARYR